MSRRRACSRRRSPRSRPRSTPTRSTPTTRLREQLDLDSMDFLNVIAALNERTGVDVPEADYPQLATIGSAADYLATRR